MIPSLLPLLEDLPDAQSAEVIEILAESPGVRIERIVSGGQASPPGFWYDQDEHEWVMLLAGSATLQWEDGSLTDLSRGDALVIPAHKQHRVAMTSDPAVWLAVFWKPCLDEDSFPQLKLESKIENRQKGENRTVQGNIESPDL